MLRRCLFLLVMLTACNLQYGEPPPLPTPDLPQIEFQAPANNDSISEGTEIEISLVARDDGIGVGRIELLIDDLPHNEAFPEVSAAVPVFAVNMNWLAAGIGFHSLTAIAYRPDGTAGRPATISILVVPGENA